MPLATLQGDSNIAGEAAGFGLLDAGTARDLVAAAARNAGTRWCVTALHPDGTAAAHACAAGRHPHPPDPRQLKFNAVIPGPCNHAQAQHAYRPSRKLRHLVAARNATCTAPGCSRPAMGCDLDHTTPWHHGGPTCPCNIAPLCRHHHRCKQAEGWWLEQPEPGRPGLANTNGTHLRHHAHRISDLAAREGWPPEDSRATLPPIVLVGRCQ